MLLIRPMWRALLRSPEQFFYCLKGRIVCGGLKPPERQFPKIPARHEDP